jgi:hypothetical protein
MAKMEKTAEQKLVDVRSYLKAEIKRRKQILEDDFCKSNMYGAELSLLEIEMVALKRVLKEVGK